MLKRVLNVGLSIIICVLSMFVCPMNVVQAIETQSANEESILLYEKMFIGLGDQCELEFSVEVEEYYVFSLDYSIVSVSLNNSVYSIVGEALGKTTVYVNYYNEEGRLTTATCEVSVFDEYAPKSNDDYYLYLNTRDVVLSGNAASLAHSVQPWSTKTDGMTLWTISSIDDEYFSIKLKSNNVYLGVNSNNQVRLYTTLQSTPTRWRFLVNPNGKTVIVPQGLEHSNYALGYNGSTAVITDYYTDLSARNWKLFSKTFYIDNYYDTSARKTLSGTTHSRIRMSIPDANEFTTAVYEAIGFNVETSGYPTYRSDLLADACPLGDNTPCNSTCETAHKEIYMMSAELYTDVPRDNNHIVVLWGDRSNSVYTENGSSYSGDLFAHQYGITHPIQGAVDYPVIDVFTVTKLTTGEITDIDQIRAMMSIILAHEVAHVFGMAEPYDDPAHSESNGVYCIMNALDPNNCSYFCDLIEGGQMPFCDDCIAFLEDSIPEILYHGN